VSNRNALEKLKLCRSKKYHENIPLIRSGNDRLSWKGSQSLFDILDCFGDRLSKIGGRFLDFFFGGIPEDSKLGYFWMDTLCIPLGEENESLRREAINKMAFIHSAAEHVLVIDQTVKKISSQDSTDVAIASKFLTCPWMTRAWTFQEACLARQFSFLLKDAVIDPRRWITNRAPSDRSNSAYEFRTKDECIQFIEEMPDIMNDRSPKMPRIAVTC
jgi:hypothetical protein